MSEPVARSSLFYRWTIVLGALVPFLIFLLYGMQYTLRDAKNQWLEPVMLAAMILFMLVSEIVTDWTVFASQYNWYHA